MKIPSLEQLDHYVSLKKLTRNDNGDMSIFNYTEDITYSREWDDVTMAARGLILNRVTGEVVARPFTKFFNYGEYDVEVEIPDRPPDVATVKLDGSLGISYFDRGNLLWATRGQFFSVQALAAQQIWDSKYHHVQVLPEFTLLAEIIHPSSRNVIHYDYEDLVLLGIVNRHTGRDYPYNLVAEWAAANGMRVTEQVEATFEQLVERAKTLHYQHEGFVLRWGDHRVKVKGHAYCEMARVIKGLTERHVADLWYAGQPLPFVPEESRKWAETVITKLDMEAVTWTEELSALIADKPRTSKKEYAASIERNHPLFALAMRAFDRDPDPSDIRLFTYKQIFGNSPRPI